jgi:hypothetical protein
LKENEKMEQNRESRKRIATMESGKNPAVQTIDEKIQELGSSVIDMKA